MLRGNRVAALAPVLLALFPVLVIAQGNVGEYTWGELAAVALLLGLCGALALVGAVLILRRRSRSAAALVASVVALWLAGSPLAADRMAVIPPRFAVPLLGLAGAVAVWAVLRRSERVDALARAVGIFSLALTCFGMTGIVRARVRTERLVSRSETARELLGPLAAPRGAARPDIYVIVLDNLANEQVQRVVYGRSNRAFEDSLRSLGFTIPSRARSNYTWTPHSVAALLNLGHVRGLERDLGPDATDWSVLYELVQHNRATRWLHDAGYTVYFEPSVGFAGTRMLATPHVTFGGRGDGALMAAVARNRLLTFALHSSVPGRALERAGVHPYYHAARLRALRTVADVAGEPGPKFVLAHSLAAHEPFVFDESCHPQSDEQMAQRGEKRAYVAVVECTERLVLAAVTGILARSHTPPVIVLQADHGPMSLHASSTDASTVTPAQARERAGAFGAYLLPGPAAAALPETMTPANVLRFVFREYLDAPIEPVPDSTYFASLAEPFRFVNVTVDVTGAVAAAVDSIGAGRPASH